jgi:hypothetical protein
MPDTPNSSNFEDLTHQFHEKYRTTGIALAISLATFASAECWFFYKLFLNFSDKENCIQNILWICVIVTAICLFGFSFILQFLHYFGMKEMAQSFFHAYKYEINSSDDALKKERNDSWDKARCFFRKADWIIRVIKYLAISNFIAVILYFILYKPNVS